MSDGDSKIMSKNTVDPGYDQSYDQNGLSKAGTNNTIQKSSEGTVCLDPSREGRRKQLFWNISWGI